MIVSKLITTSNFRTGALNLLDVLDVFWKREKDPLKRQKIRDAYDSLFYIISIL